MVLIVVVIFMTVVATAEHVIDRTEWRRDKTSFGERMMIEMLMLLLMSGFETPAWKTTQVVETCYIWISLMFFKTKTKT